MGTTKHAITTVYIRFLFGVRWEERKFRISAYVERVRGASTVDDGPV